MTPPQPQIGPEAAVAAAARSAQPRHVGLVITALHDGGEATHGAGLTRAGGSAPEATTMFQIGSITKVFTALLLADCAVRREVTLDTTVTDCIPALAGTAADDIALRHLASHTSGLPRLPKGFIRQALRPRDDPYREFTTDDLLAGVAAARRSRRTAPGRRVRYSNFGAALLGEALSRRTGLPYDELVRARVTDPLGLADTVVRPDPYQLERKATGHSRRKRPVPDWDLGAMTGAGALYSTPADLLTFLRAQLDPEETPLTEAFRLVQQPQATATRWLSVGLGWHLSPVRDVEGTSLWHNGGTGGFFSYLALHPQARVGVVVLSNTARSVDRVGHQLLRELTR